MYDNFHAFVNDNIEVDGGWSGFPKDWEKKSLSEKRGWIKEFVQGWTTIKVETVLKFWLAG